MKLKTLKYFLEFLGDIQNINILDTINNKEYPTDINWEKNKEGIPGYLEFLLERQICIVTQNEYGTLFIELN